jgi:competence protein ComEC
VSGSARQQWAGPAAALDLRLVPAAVLSWLVAILGLTAGWESAAAVASVSALLMLSVLVARWRRRGYAARPGALILLAAAGSVASVGLVVAAQVHQHAVHPLRAAAEHAAAVTARVVLTGDPAPVLTPESVGYGGRGAGAAQFSVPAELVSARAAGASWRLGGRILLLAPAAGWSDLLPGTELTVSGLLAPATRPDLTVAVLRVRGPPAELTQPPWWQRGLGVLRHGLRTASQAALPERPAALLPGLAIGDTSAMSWPLREEFRTTGLTHLTAVSGANVIFVVGAVCGLLSLARAGPKTTVVCGLLALVGFVLLARPSPSVLRAAVMGGVGLLGVFVGRRRPVLPALAASVIGLLLAAPALGTDPGFALSVVATCALVLLAPGWAAGLRRVGVPPGVAEAIAVPSAAHLVTAPLIAGLAGQVSLVAVLANLAVAPVVAPVTVLGVLAAVLSPLGATPAQLCAWLAGPGVRWLVGVAHWGAGIPDGVLPWPDGVAGAALLASTLLAGVALLRLRRLRVLVLAGLVGLLLVLVPTRFVTPGWPATGWALVACDVGQGDAMVLSTGQRGVGVLVDTGTETGAVDGCLRRLGVVSLALVVLTHLHADHIGGLAAALAGRGVGAVAVGPVHRPEWAFDQVRRIAAAQGSRLVELHSGQHLHWSGLALDVLGPVHPHSDIDPEDGSEVNDTSVVMRAHTAAGTVLLTGDVELLAQADLLSSGADLRADVLKVPHHGSRYSLPAFLARVHPRLALVSVGAGNRYGHPNQSLLGRLRQGGVLVRRTDESGDVAVVATRAGPAAVARGYPQPAPRRG